MNSIFALIAGFGIGCLDWFLLYKLFKKIILSEEKGIRKIPFLLLILKLFVFLGILYVAVRLFRDEVFFVITGITLSLVGFLVVVGKLRTGNG